MFFYILSIFVPFFTFFLIPCGWIRLFRIKNRTHINFWLIAVQIHFALSLLSFSIFIIGIASVFVSETPEFNPVALTIYNEAIKPCTLANNSVICLFILTFFERLIATAKSKSYEISTTSKTFIFGSFLCWSYGIANILGWNVFKVDISILQPISEISSAIALLCIFGLWKMNQRFKKIRETSNLILSQRYQIDENIRMIRYIAPFSIIGTIIFAAANLITGCLEDAFSLSITIPTRSITFFSLVSLSSFFIYFYETYKEFRFYKRNLKFGNNTKIGVQQNLFEIDFKLNSNFDETNHYFEQLRISWNK